MKYEEFRRRVMLATDKMSIDYPCVDKLRVLAVVEYVECCMLGQKTIDRGMVISAGDAVLIEKQIGINDDGCGNLHETISVRELINAIRCNNRRLIGFDVTVESSNDRFIVRDVLYSKSRGLILACVRSFTSGGTDVRSNILDKANACVCGERATDCGRPEDSFGAMAQMLTVYLRQARPDISYALGARPLTAKDAAMALAISNVARIATGHTPDSYVDLAGYAACAGELDQNMDKRTV